MGFEYHLNSLEFVNSITEDFSLLVMETKCTRFSCVQISCSKSVRPAVSRGPVFLGDDCSTISSRAHCETARVLSDPVLRESLSIDEQ